MIRKIFAVLLVFAMFFAATAVSTNASDVSLSAEPGNPRTRVTHGYGSQSLIGQQMTYAFYVPSSMPEWRVWMQNTSSANYIVTITKGTPYGNVEWSGTLSGNSTLNVWSNHAYAQDNYFVNFTYGAGSMSGSVAARVASTHAEILP